MTDLTPTELDKALAQHRQMDTHADGPRCAQIGCYKWKWPCLVARLAEEVKRRRDIARLREMML